MLSIQQKDDKKEDNSYEDNRAYFYVLLYGEWGGGGQRWRLFWEPLETHLVSWPGWVEFFPFFKERLNIQLQPFFSTGLKSHMCKFIIWHKRLRLLSWILLILTFYLPITFFDSTAEYSWKEDWLGLESALIFSNGWVYWGKKNLFCFIQHSNIMITLTTHTVWHTWSCVCCSAVCLIAFLPPVNTDIFLFRYPC